MLQRQASFILGAVEQYLRYRFTQQAEVIYCKYSQQIQQENLFVNL